jgi:hypothetical protein
LVCFCFCLFIIIIVGPVLFNGVDDMERNDIHQYDGRNYEAVRRHSIVDDVLPSVRVLLSSQHIEC